MPSRTEARLPDSNSAAKAQEGVPAHPHDGAADRALMARSLVYLFGAGAAIALLSLILPANGDEVGIRPSLPGREALGCAVAAMLLCLTIWLGRARLHLWAYELILALGTGLISTATLFSPDPTGAFSAFYVLIALFAAYFFSRRAAVMQLALIGLAYAIVLMVAGQQATGAGQTSFARWLTLVGTLSVAAFLIRVLRERVERLIDRLADAARTDVLTGLLNRRGFQDVFEAELERSRRGDRPLALIVGDIDYFKTLNDRFGHARGDEALERLAGVLLANKRRIDTAARIGGEEFAVLVPEADDHEAYVLAERLRRDIARAFEGTETEVTMSFGVASSPKHGASAALLFHSADEALYAAKELGRNRSVIHNAEVAGALAGEKSRRDADREGFLATVLALAEALDVRDSGTSRHSQTVARLAEMTARQLELDEERVDRVRIGGLLHDVGKIGVPDSILKKPGPLSQEDWREMRKHPTIGARILDSATVEDIRAWVLAHHERPDGLGYPNGLMAAQIPLESRILAVADAYEAMTADRVYRRALTQGEARQELRRGAGTQFDAMVVDAFLTAVEHAGERAAVA